MQKNSLLKTLFCLILQLISFAQNKVPAFTADSEPNFILPDSTSISYGMDYSKSVLKSLKLKCLMLIK